MFKQLKEDMNILQENKNKGMNVIRESILDMKTSFNNNMEVLNKSQAAVISIIKTHKKKIHEWGRGMGEL